ncbi:retrovirus-related pol polyprotein from transposon TNT 1-94 [Tanacetum coccineum]
MTTLAKHIIVDGAENRLPMLEKSMYDSWASPQQLQDDCDVQEKNIILHGLPPDVYELVNHQEAAKDIWDRVKLLITPRVFRMTMQQVQVNTKFLNALPPKWSKFVTDVKLAKSLYTTNYDQLYAYPSFHLQTINSERLPIPKIRQPFKMEESQFNKFKEDKLRVLLALETEELLQPQGETMQLVKQRCNTLEVYWDAKTCCVMIALRVFGSTSNKRLLALCTQPKRPRSSAWFKEKLMLAELQEAGQILDEEQLAFIADPGIAKESQDAGIQDTNSSAPNDLLVLSLVEQMNDHVANLDKENQTNKMVKEKESLSTTLTIFKTKSKEKESKYIDKEIVLENQNKELENILSQLIKPTLYDGSVIAKEHDVISVIDDEETLILEEESRSKMLDKQNDPILIKHKINISPIDYSKLNKLKEDFGKRFVTKKELSAEQAFWFKHSNYNPDTSIKSYTPVRIEALSELHKVSLVNESLKKLKYQLASFDKVVKKRTTSDAITASVWGLELTKACFVTEIIPFLKVLKDTFNAFDKTFLDEITEVQTVFNQMEAAIDQCSSVENSDLNAQLQEKVFAIAALKNELRKLKGKMLSILLFQNLVPLLLQELNTTTSASGSKPSGNTKKNRISRPPSSNQKNKVEEHPRKVKSSLNKMNFVSEPISNAHVKHSMRNAKFESICAICNKCLFDANHDMCVIDYVNDVNVRSKSKSKRNKMRKVWKPTSCPDCSMIFGLRMLQAYDRKSFSTHQLCLGHNLFSMGQFCDSDLEVAFRKHTCFIRDLEGVDLLKGSRGSNLFTLSMENLLLSSPICLLSKASKTKSMRIQSINGRKYILVIVDDYSWFTWVKFLRSKDEVPKFVIKFLKMIQVRLNATIRNIRTDNGTEFVYQTLRAYYEEVRISHQTSVACSPQHNGIVERWNRTLVEVARTMSIFSKALLFLWVEAVATAFFW